MNKDIFQFFKLMIAFRKAHPSISRSCFWREDVKWYGVENRVDMSASSQQLAFYLHGSSQQDADIYLLINASSESVRFGVHEGVIGDWQRVVDTARDSPEDVVDSRDAVVDDVIYQVSHIAIA